MGQEVIFARYGLLMEGQPLQSEVGGEGYSRPGYFWGTLFEGRQAVPLPNGACHYPVAVLTPPRRRIRCEVCTRTVESVEVFWQRLLEAEMFWPHRSAEQSLMNLATARVFLEAGEGIECPLFVLNPVFYVFWREAYGMELREIAQDPDGFVSWRGVPPWRPA
ncbi:MAG: hypothetical protein HZB55_23160 [Deltaproteobacteria bacterium]|nr:hypothetical protein [Deltaproteobacteria bacterium]